MNTKSKQLIIALGASLSFAASASTPSTGNPFQAEKLPHGYTNATNTMNLVSAECDTEPCDTTNTENTNAKTTQGKCGAGKCSGDKKGIGKCGTGKCGANQQNGVENGTKEVKPTDQRKD